MAAQGLLRASPFGGGLAGAHRAIKHLGYLQIDSIAVVQRAHHHVLYSRVPQYRPEMLDALLSRRAVFEYWAHAAAILPMEDFRFSLPYKHAIKSGQVHWYKQPDKRLMRELLVRIRSDGPLRSRDLESRKTKTSGWWDWKPTKRALEQLYMQGDLMVSDRAGFQKTYDLPERVLPEGVDTATPSVEELAQHLLQQQLRTNALVSQQGLTYLRRITGLKPAVKVLLEELLAAQQLQTVRLSSGALYWCEAGLLDRALPRVKNRVVIVSPFDNAVIQRERLQALFGFDYQLECYVPTAQRRFGYFSLPLLYRDKFVGRMDCKAHRTTAELEIKRLHLESPDSENASFITALSEALTDFAAFQECRSLLLSAAISKPLRLCLEALLD